mgnify:CR=1 FL=1|tara:strand:+ start:280 stop:1602 length:1323 start_codon:yes stop_codon:yes gene_type:complete
MKVLKILLFLFITDLYSQDIFLLKDRSNIIDNILKERIENLLPEIMQKEAIDMWVLIAREYNEDPIIKTFLPSTWLNARRRTILVLYINDNKELETVSISRYDFGKIFKSIWSKEKEPDQWKALSNYIIKKKPTKIAINISDNYALADGLAKTDYDGLLKVLPNKYIKRLVSSEPIAVSWIEKRSSSEMNIYSQLVEITHKIIKEAFSTKVITPGITSTHDIVWWLRQKVSSLGLSTWFHPTVDVQRKDNSDLYSFDSKSKYDIIYPGDLVHCDFGISYLRLNTDCQQLAYVLKPGETEAPVELKKALEKGNRVQDLLTQSFEKGRSGNYILKKALNLGFKEGLRPQIYTHPLGLFGHSAGTTIGMWDSQEGVKGSGEHFLDYKTAYAIELNVKVYIKSWKKDVRIMLEEAGYYDLKGFRYINGRQKKIILIGEKLENIQ